MSSPLSFPGQTRRRTRTLPWPHARLFYKKRESRRKTAMTPTLRLAFFTVAATLGYLGLAILGWGGFEAFFSHSALIALVVADLVLTGAALFSNANLNPGEREDRANRWVLAAFALTALLMAYLPAYTDRKEFWTFDGETIRWIGVVLFTFGGALRIWPAFVLG